MGGEVRDVSAQEQGLRITLRKGFVAAREEKVSGKKRHRELLSLSISDKGSRRLFFRAGSLPATAAYVVCGFVAGVVVKLKFTVAVWTVVVSCTVCDDWLVVVSVGGTAVTAYAEYWPKLVARSLNE